MHASSSVRFKIVAITTAILFFTAGINTIISSLVFRKEYSSALQSKIFVVGQSVKGQLERLLSLGIPLTELVGFEEQLQETIAKNKEISSITVVDTQGNTLFHSDPTFFEEETHEPPPEEERVTLRQTSYETFVPVLDSSGNFIGAIRLNYPINLIRQKTNQLIFQSLGVATLSFLVAIVLLILALNKSVVHPLKKLVEVIEEIRVKGDLTKKVQIETEDELGQLARAFNEMTTKLGESYQILEQKVQERTAEVEEAKKQLETINLQLDQKVKERTAELERLKSGLEQTVTQRTQELNQKLAELEQMNKFMVGREIRMAEMKEELEELKKKVQ